MTLSITTLSMTKLCRYAKCHCAEFRDLFIVMLNVFSLNVIMQSVVAPINLLSRVKMCCTYLQKGSPTCDIN
jgi:hypothetical protein